MTAAIRLVLLLLMATSANAKNLAIQIQHTFAGKPLLTDSIRYQNQADETLSITRLSYLLSGFEVSSDNQNQWQTLPEQFVWIDAAKRRTSFVLTGLPDTPITKLRFNIGLDPKSNATDPTNLPANHPLNPNLNGLHWSWQGGYIFLAIEGHFRNKDSTELNGFSYHFANDPNRTTITITLNINTHTQLPLQFDLEPVLTNINITTAGSSTHSREGDPIASTIKSNLPSAWSSIESPITSNTQEPKPVAQPKYPPNKSQELYRFSFDPKFSFPKLPTDNPLTIAGVALGERLFNDPILSRNNTISCASCHQAHLAFSDPRPFSLGVDDQVGTRNSMPLFNLAWKDSFFWDGRAPTIRAQVLHPIQDPLEMDQSLDATVLKLSTSEHYPNLFNAAFGVPGIDPERLALALEQYLLTLTSYQSKLDLASKGKATLSPQEQRGFQLFFTEYEPRNNQLGADCFHCHGGALFTNHGFANNGLDPTFTDLGLATFTKNTNDAGKFSVPSLRNVALTAPYMHDGRFNTLEEVIDHYDHGLQRSPTLDPNLAKHPKSGIQLSAEDKAALVAFLKTLTEE